DAMLVLHRRLVLHLHDLAFFPRRHRRLDDVLDRDDIGELRLRHLLVAADGAGAEHHHRDAPDGHSLDHGRVHVPLLVVELAEILAESTGDFATSGSVRYQHVWRSPSPRGLARWTAAAIGCTVAGHVATIPRW